MAFLVDFESGQNFTRGEKHANFVTFEKKVEDTHEKPFSSEGQLKLTNCVFGHFRLFVTFEFQKIA